MNRKEFVEIAIASLRKWQHNNATLRAAALAFFIILPLPSLLLITADVYSQFLGQAQGTQQLILQISALAGPTIASLVGELLQSAANPFTSVFNSFVSVVFAVAGAVGAFAVLQDTLNVLWDVKLPKNRSIKTRVRERFVPFASVLGAAVIVFGLLEFTSLLTNSVHDALVGSIGVFATLAFLFSIQLLFSFGSAILLFAIIFKEIPDTVIEWGDVWLGAIITALAFTILNYLFRFYLQSFPVTSLAGAAGSLIILLLWVFVIAQFLLYGAQFTHCSAETWGSHAEKGENHQHPWKRWRAEDVPDGKMVPERIQNAIKGSQLGKSEEENGLSAETQFEKTEPAKFKSKEMPSTEPEKQQIPVSEAKAEEKPEPKPQVFFPETESSDASEREYDVSLKRRTKKKSPRKKEGS